MNFIHVKGPEILDKYIGASEENVRKLFERSEKDGPSILFFDEIDSIVPQRNSDVASVTDRIVNQFLVYLDGVDSLERTFVVASTSRPDLIDKAVLRPGRIDTKIFCDLPSIEERKRYLKDSLNQFQLELDQDFIKTISQRTNGFSFADMGLIFKNFTF